MTHVKASKGKVKIVGLVRNKDGEPQFNDYGNIPEVYHPHLSEQDWAFIERQKEAQQCP